ncbi:hypothetical protein QQ045_025452 [Rhodiola kirilowii]
MWRGSCDKKGGHLVKWDDVCRDKEEGGLGLKNIETMNFAMIINQMWGKKEARTSLCSDWLEKYWSKRKHWWEDEVKAIASGFSSACCSARRLVFKHKALVEWYKLVWNDFNAPRDSLNAWLVVQNKLMTRDKMSHWAFLGAKTCVLCETMDESRDHLYFECCFTKEVWNMVMHFLQVESACSHWELLIPWFKGLPQMRLKTKMIAAATTRVMNGVWKARNMKIF